MNELSIRILSKGFTVRKGLWLLFRRYINSSKVSQFINQQSRRKMKRDCHEKRLS